MKRLVKQDPEIRVLLDVGAQMLELKTENLHYTGSYFARPDVSAAIFFNGSDHLTVVTPDGATEPFISSLSTGSSINALYTLLEVEERISSFPKECARQLRLAQRLLNIDWRLVQGKVLENRNRNTRLTKRGHRLYANASAGERPLSLRRGG